ncbi:SLBB domain-containing protein [Gemmatimonadota bacterium]
MIRRSMAGIAAWAVFALLAFPHMAQAQLPPNVTLEQLQSLTPQQRAQLIALLQGAGAQAGQVQAEGAQPQIPSSLIPQPQLERAVTRVDTTQFYVENPYDFGVAPQESDEVAELQLFGRAMFQESPEAFQPPQYGPVGPDYRLGPGDELFITIWGAVQTSYNPSINREGYVVLPNAGQVVLANLTLEEANRRLLQVLTPHHQTLAYGRQNATSFLDISLGRLRAIDVYVMGDVQHAGSYSLSSISTAFTALYAAGGPSNRGSLRNIRILRAGGSVAQLDAYDYLLRGDKSGDPRLENGDVLFVPPIGPQVVIKGSVLRPAVYELKAGEALRELIQTAGGLIPSALLERAEVGRIVPFAERGETPWAHIMIGVDLREVMSEAGESFRLVDRDVVTVLRIPTDRRNFVVVEGAVWSPGRLEHRVGMTLRTAIQAAGGLREEALQSRVEVIRTLPDETTQIFASILSEVMLGNPDENLALEHRDRVRVYSIHEVFPRKYARIYGQVQRPGQYLLHENMTLMDLVTRAGGLTKDAFTEWADVARVRLAEDGSVAEFETMKVPLNTDYAPTRGDGFPLQDFDQVFIRQRPQWDVERNVEIRGEVLFPGKYSLRRDDEKMSEVIQRAGGLTPYAYPEGARFYREWEAAGRVNVCLGRALARPTSDDNIVMQPGDSLYVPPRVNFVTVRGAVGHPSSVIYVPGRGPQYYIQLAGNYDENADRKHTRVILPNGSAWRPRWFFIPNPEVEPGSEIIVPVRPESARNTWEIIRDTTAILSSLTTVLLLVWQISK